MCCQVPTFVDLPPCTSAMVHSMEAALQSSFYDAVSTWRALFRQQGQKVWDPGSKLNLDFKTYQQDGRRNEESSSFGHISERLRTVQHSRWGDVRGNWWWTVQVSKGFRISFFLCFSFYAVKPRIRTAANRHMFEFLGRLLCEIGYYSRQADVQMACIC